MKKVLWLFVFCAVLYAPTGWAEVKTRVFVVMSMDVQPFDEAFEGFKNQLSKEQCPVEYAVYDVKELRENVSVFYESLERLKPRLIYSIGTPSTVFLRDQKIDTPLIYAMVLNPVESGLVSSGEENVKDLSGVSLNIPIEEQFRVARTFFPEMKTIGMLYDAQKKKYIKDEAWQAARQHGYELFAKPIHASREVMKQLEDLLTKADILWAGVDPLIYNASSKEHILLETFKFKKPFIAFSAHYVQSGALMALECDYTAIGSQAGSMAAHLIRSGELLPAQEPRRIHIYLNKHTADQLGLTFSDELLQQARIVR